MLCWSCQLSNLCLSFPASGSGSQINRMCLAWHDSSNKNCWWEERGPGLVVALANIVRRIDMSGTYVPLFQHPACPDLLCLSVCLLLLSCCPLPGVCQLFLLLPFFLCFVLFIFFPTLCFSLFLLLWLKTAIQYQDSIWAPKQKVSKLCCEMLQHEKAGSLRASSFSLIDSLNCLRKTRKFLPFSPCLSFRMLIMPVYGGCLPGGELKPSDANSSSCLEPQTHQADVKSILMRGA